MVYHSPADLIWPNGPFILLVSRCFILFFKDFEQCEIIFSRVCPCHDTLFSGSFTLVQTFSVSISYLTLSCHELNVWGWGKTVQVVFKYPPRSLPQKEVGGGWGNTSLLTPFLFPSCSVDNSSKDDVTVILHIGVSFMFPSAHLNCLPWTRLEAETKLLPFFFLL